MENKTFETKVENAITELSDELFLAFYKPGTIKPGEYSKEQVEVYLEAATRMSKDKSWGNTEKAYEIGIGKLIKDCENALKNMKCDMTKWEIGTDFWTGEVTTMLGNQLTFDIKHWEITAIRTFETMFQYKTIYEVKALDVRHTINTTGNWVFLKDELYDIAWDSEDEIYAYEEKWRETEPKAFKLVM
jgi:hypothetical protein